MLRLVLLLLLMGFGLMLFYQNIHFPHLKYIPLSERLLAPFDHRIRYRIGEIDPRFGLTQHQLQQLAFEATQIWQQTGEPDYFVYDPNARLSIDLIYDQRQSETQSRQHSLSEIEQKQTLWQQRHDETEQMQQQIAHLRQALQQKRDDLQQATQRYNRQVQQINAQGGASPEQRFRLEQQNSQLQQQQQQLEAQIQSHNQNIHRLNQHVAQLNALNQELSAQISSFNSRFTGKTFDKGVFNGRQIVIYEFSSKDDLRLTLAHEFGHALGLGHHHDPEGLMHPLLQQQKLQNFQLTPADLQLLAQR